MKVVFNDRGESEKSLEDIVENYKYDSFRGSVESIEMVAINSIRLSSSLIDLLWKKGVLGDDDVKELISKFGIDKKDIITLAD